MGHVFQTDDLYDSEIFCGCQNKHPKQNGKHDHWECEKCGYMLDKKDRPGKQYDWYRGIRPVRKEKTNEPD